MRRYALLIGTVVALSAGAFLISTAQQPGPQPPPGAAIDGFEPSSLTPFEKRLLDQARLAGAVYENQVRETADHNARGLILTEGDAAIVDLSVTGRKYGVSLDGTGDVLIKNFSFVDRRSTDAYGSGLVMGFKSPTRGQTYLSNAYIDLQESGPNANYRVANNEAISVERGSGLLNVRQAVLIGAQESGIDNKGDARMDAVFIASGHRPVRIWSGGSLTLTNSIVLAMPGFGGFWLGGGTDIARLDYYNCKFGRVGDKFENLSSEIPKWMIAIDDGVDARITHLRRDPLPRGADTFWVSIKTPVPRGFLAGR
ncbi:MAG: hypothetical protein Q8R82_22425 [Hyphomonadaceae bacterium]|nr:hypothetical protein [Hyphomonadaceae bacterium]